MRILVTGAGGYVGTFLVPSARAAGHEVIAVGRERGDVAALLDGDDLPTVEAVIHTAARSPGPGVTAADFVPNVTAVRALANFARRRRVRRVVHLSSLSLHGRVAVPVVDETTPAIDPDPYGASKLMGEMILRDLAAEIPVASLRLPGVVGPGAERPWLARLVRRALRGETLVVYNPDGAFNNAAHVAELCPFLLSLAAAEDWRGFEAMTLGTAGRTTIGALAGRVRDLAGGRSAITVGEAASNTFTLCNRRAAGHGWAPMDIQTLLPRLVDELKETASE
ncbi:MAG: NAD(P)-dependent oxidoreductase [Alphaproteobacteria bacterium]|nr:NAD(P)-dependent oxidoreductase [Alphaproteobacteria bacterium]